jgi:hypothetical protein
MALNDQSHCLNYYLTNFFCALNASINTTAHIRHQCGKTSDLNCHRCLINTGVEKNKLLLNIDFNFDHQMSLTKSKCWYSNNSLHFFIVRCSITKNLKENQPILMVRKNVQSNEGKKEIC